MAAQIESTADANCLAIRRQDCSLPPGIKGQRWAQARRYRCHVKGPVLVLFQIYPLPFFCAGWIPFAGQLCVPCIVGGFVEPDGNLVETRLDLLMEEEFAVGPTQDLIERSEKIAKQYAENGRKGGRPKRTATAAAKTATEAVLAPDWRKKFPKWYFLGGAGSQKVLLRGPDPQRGETFGIPVHRLCEDWEGKDIGWWNQHGPTKEMMEKHQAILSAPPGTKAAKKEN